jgi:molybdate transport repressor ModE-like protein
MSELEQDDASPTTEARLESSLGGRLDRLRLRHLRLMDLISRLGSLSAAAQALHISQPGVTKMLQEVEAAFGQTLIERTTKGGRLTAAGLNVLDRLRIALQAVGSARESLKDSPELQLIRIGVLPLVGVSALPSVLRQLQAENRLPRIHIQQGTVESLLLALHRGEVDCAVTVLETIGHPDIYHQLAITPLWKEPLVVVASPSHPILRRKALSLGQLRVLDWVMMPHVTSARRALDRIFLRAGMPPPVPRVETESFHIGLSLVATSRQIMAVPYSAYVQYQPRVKRVPIAEKFTSGTVVFITLSGTPQLPAVQDLARGFQCFAQKYPVEP